MIISLISTFAIADPRYTKNIANSEKQINTQSATLTTSIDVNNGIVVNQKFDLKLAVIELFTALGEVMMETIKMIKRIKKKK